MPPLQAPISNFLVPIIIGLKLHWCTNLCIKIANVRFVLLGTTFDLCCIRATKHRMVTQPVKASQAIEEGEHMRRARPLWLVSPYEETVWGWGEVTWLGSVKAEPVM